MEIANHEHYVSLEIANLLKEAGFDWKCRGIYVLDSENDPEYVFSTANFTNTSKEIEGYIRLSAPTLDVVQRWLREIKGIFICTTPEIKDYYATWNFYICNEQGLFYENEDCFLTYEEAQEAGIKKTLEIILEEEK